MSTAAPAAPGPVDPARPPPSSPPRAPYSDVAADSEAELPMMDTDEHPRTDAQKGQKHSRLWEWKEEIRIAMAEACGTALLVLLSCLPAAAPPAVRAVAAGAVVGLLVQCFDHISGAMFNPVVTLAALVWGRVSVPRALSMACAQLAGAALGAAALHALVPPGTPAPGVTLPAPGYHLYKALCVEAAAGGCLALANCASWDPRNVTYRDSWPLRIGTCVTALSLVAVELTGASMNPARSFGPALLAAEWTAHWLYWVGPLGGSAACTVLYTAAWRPAGPARAPPVPRSPAPSRQASRLSVRV